MRKELKLYIIIGLLIILMCLEFAFLGGLQLLFQMAQEVNSASEEFIKLIARWIS